MSLSDGSMAPRDEDASRHRLGYEAIRSRVPAWLPEATGEARKTMGEQGQEALPWVAAAMTSMPTVVAHLHQDYLEHLALKAQADTWLGALPDPQRFAEPLLAAALRERFGIEVDVRRTWLLHPRRMQTDDSFLTASRDWMVESFKAFRVACQPLLGMALQNFEAWESAPGGMDLPVTKARIFTVEPGQALWDGTILDIAPEAFAALCRELDLGRRYQERIEQTFAPEPGAGATSDKEEREDVFQCYERSGLLILLHLARMQGHLGETAYQAVLKLVHGVASTLDGVAFESGSLTLWNVPLSGIVVFGGDRTARAAPDRIVVYIPGDPDEPLREHASFLDFCAHLRDRLVQADYLAFFQRFIPLRQRARLLDRLHQAFHPKVWNPGGWYEEVLDRQASLPFREGALEAPLMPALLRRKIAGLKDDGLFLAVPTATQDHKSLEQKLDYFAQAGLFALNALAFSVPVLGAAMLVFSSAQLAHEVYEGIGEWTRDEREQAWAYLLDVVENLALVAALGGAQEIRPGVPARELPRLPDVLHPARLADGGTRLWSRNLVPFAHDIILPGDLKADVRGLYRFQGRQWLALDGRHYSLLADAQGAAYLEHPQRIDAYRPRVRYHGGGVWLHELDQPRGWSGLQLFQRFGAVAAGLDETEARQLLLISGCHESALRQTLADGQRPPALLLDCLERYQIHRELVHGEEVLSAEHHARLFDMRYRSPVAPPGPAQRVLLRDFAGLPRRIVQELLAHASEAERALIRDRQRVPQRLAEEARLYLQSVRLARAYEGLYLPPLSNNDSTRLMLHSLAALPGWAEQYRIEIRGLRVNGPLLDSVGPNPAVHCRILVKSLEGYRTAEEPGLAADDLFSVVLRTLTEAQRSALGLAATATGEDLRGKVMAHPLGRPALRKVLHMQPVRPAMRSPMRLANGRRGYPLSGGARLGPRVSENTLLDKIRLLELPDLFAGDLLQQLRGAALDDQAIDARLDGLLEEREALRRALPLGEAPRQTFDDQPPLSDRQLIELALWQHWRDNLLPEIGRNGVPLRLFAVSLEAFPEQLPEFFRTRVQSLELSSVSVPVAVVTPGDDGLMRLDDRLLQLLRSFPRVTSLEIDAVDGRSLFDLPRIIVGAYPRLAELRLLNLHLPLGQEVLEELCRLSELNHLDLSGNRPSHLPVHLAGRLQLKFLGLDRLGLEQWPEWLDNDMLDGIERISLRDNRLTDLPAHLRVNPADAPRSTSISLRGNLFSQQALIGIRASAWRGRRFVFELDVPQNVEHIVEGMMVEHQALSSAIDGWLETSRREAAPRLAARRSLGDALLAGWLTQIDGAPVRSLVLEDLHLDDFPPTLPAFYFDRISRLEVIRAQGTAQALDTLIMRFPRLERLSLAQTPLEGLPAALGGLPDLRQLALTDANLVVDQAVIDGLARLPGITSLDLAGNRLGEIREVSAFSRLQFNLLSLERMEISRWPAWLDPLLPERVQWLNLNHNRLTTLPAHLLENAESVSGSTEICLEGNPLSEDTLFSAHLSEGLTRPYSFRLDLPEHLRRLDGSWRGSSSGGASSTGTSEADLINVDFWLEQGASINDERRQLWQRLESTGDADDLLRLVGRLRHTAEYRNGLTRPDMFERVWQVLTISGQDDDLRQVLDGMAQEPLRLLREFDTCPDGVRLEFNQMEILVFTRQALRTAVDGPRGTSLYRLMRRLFRLQELDRIAREEAGDRDEAEVRLAYRLNLASALDLPLAPTQMLYAGSANLRAGELDRAEARVRQGESGQALLDYAAQRDFWLAYLHDVQGTRFTAIREVFESQVLALDDLYPDDTPVQTSARIQSLIDQRKLDEAALIGELTHKEGLQADRA
ncbi:dermonecrotic toxin domain-containing protein [Pseudomonas wadenswilerensis]